MTKPQVFQVPRSAEGISEILKHLSLAIPDRAGYLAISQAEATKFSEAVTKVANKAPDSETILEYVRNVVAAAHPDARTAAAMTGYRAIEIVTLIDIAKREGRSFRNAVRMVLADGNRSEQGTALAYLQSLIEENGVSADGFGVATLNSDMLQTDVINKDQQQSRQSADNVHALRPENQRQDPPTSSSPAGQAQERQNDTAKKQYGESIHVYAGKAALCFAECMTRQEDKATLMIEVAQASGDVYNWQDKIMLMLTPSELPLVLGFFVGYLDKLELKGHGRQQEKAMTLTNQGNQFFITMIMRGQAPRAVPVPAKDSYPVLTMLLRQMLKNDPHLTAQLILQFSKRICDMHTAERKTAVVANG